MRFQTEHARERATYTGPPWRQPAPEVPASEADVAAFLRAYPEATCSGKCLRILAQLHRDYARPRDA